jgi:hypothetical protein
MNDDLPPWLSTREAAFECLLWLNRQPDRALHHMRLLCELAEVPDFIREWAIRPPWRGCTGPKQPGAACCSAVPPPR